MAEFGVQADQDGIGGQRGLRVPEPQEEQGETKDEQGVLLKRAARRPASHRSLTRELSGDSGWGVPAEPLRTVRGSRCAIAAMPPGMLAAPEGSA